jgi:SpoVK/Ycf46/Vps4 family AAA+-type ATPase
MYRIIQKKNSEERLVEEYIPKDEGLVARFLMSAPHKIRSLGKSYPGYKSALFFKAVNEVVKEYDVRAVFDLQYGQVVSPIYSYLEVGRGKREELLVTGMRFLIIDKKALAVYVCPGWGTVDLYMSYNEKDSELSINFMEKVDKYMADNNFYRGEKIDAAGQFLPIPELDFDDVQLPDDQKQAIKVGAIDFFNKKEIYEKNKLPWRRGMIFSGIPGTGKTMMAKILMAKSPCTFIWATSEMVNYSSDVKYLFSMAKELSPALLILEDVDAFLSHDSTVDALKTTLDGMNNVDGICTIICTNYPDRIPKPLLRPGRVDQVFIFELPKENLRYKILSKIAEPMNIENKDNVLKELAKLTEGLTGACLKELLIFGLLLAADDNRDIILEKDLSLALKKVFDNLNIVNDKIREIDVKALLIELKKNKK